MTDSLYSQFEGYEAPVQEFETPHANRQDMRKPYDNGFKKKVDNAVTESKPITGALHEFWLWFSRQQTKNVIAMRINTKFNRNMLTGDNYDSERSRYVELYNAELNVT